MSDKKIQHPSKCLHLSTYLEVVLGVKSGDYVCSDCGKTAPGRHWETENRSKEVIQ